jgi:hypothetical protein
VVLSKGFAEAFRDVDPIAPPETILPTEELPREVEVPVLVAAVEKVVEPVPKKKDRIADLLCRAERLAPTTT